MDQTENKCCCAKCRFFEARSQFCRKNPPTPLVVPDAYGSHIMSVFPKIHCPLIDWCSEFKSETTFV